MDTDLQSFYSLKEETNHWYSEDFIIGSLTKFLKDNGYKIHKETGLPAERPEKVLIASKYFTKEIIEIKGFPNKPASLSGLQKPSATTNARHWFSDALFSSFVNFGKYYSNENAEVAMALPNVEKYKAIIEKVQDYFTINNLYFKLYLVNEDGEVEVSNLNENMRK
jgi:hypothetical protein